VSISRVAQLVGINENRIQGTYPYNAFPFHFFFVRLSRMILDDKLKAIIDQTSGTISVYEEEKLDV
jgi:hypothetical protein